MALVTIGIALSDLGVTANELLRAWREGGRHFRDFGVELMTVHGPEHPMVMVELQMPDCDATRVESVRALRQEVLGKLRDFLERKR